MLPISRMKCLILPPMKFSSFHYSHFPQTSPFALLSLTYMHISRNPLTLFQNPNVLHQKPIISFPHISACSTQNRALKMEAASRIPSGEIHVIVGPMFAGKSTTLLRRIQSEKSNGSFPGQVEFAVNNFQLDHTLKGLCFSGRLNEAIRLLCRTGLPVQPGTYALLLQECIFRKEFMKGRRIHAQMIVVGFVLNEYLKTKLLILYAKSGDLSKAHILLEKLLEKSLVSWNALIACYVQNGLEAVGLSLYYEMRQGGMLPNSYTFASVFTACATLAILEHGKQAHALMIKCPIKENVVVNSALVDMYFKCSCLSDGHQAFDASQCRNVISWTALITGYGKHGRVLEVLDSFSRMKAEGYRPNYVTFLSVLSACSHGGLIDEGWEYFSSMARDYGVQPKVQHYAAMVDLLGRAGRLHEAYEFLMSCPCQDHPVIWGALLGASRIHGDMDLVKLAADRYLELEPDNAGKYVVLSNAYATFGLWDGVAKVRAIMRDLGVTKEPSYSRIEVQGKVHSLHKGDKSHRQSKEIHEMVNTITCMVKDVEYVPDIDDLGDC